MELIATHSRPRLFPLLPLLYHFTSTLRISRRPRRNPKSPRTHDPNPDYLVGAQGNRAAAAGADEPATWPVLPVTTAASIAEAPVKASQISYQEDVAGDIDSGSPSDAPTPPPSVMGGSSSPSSCTSCAPTVGSCCSECLSQCRGSCLTPFVGVEAAFLAPVMNHGGGGSSYGFSGTGVSTTSISTSSVNGMVVTPRLWLGVMGPCWGVGVRYWRFSNGNGDPGPATGANEGLFNQSFLRLQTLDLEAIRRIPCCGRNLWFSAGVRFGQFTRNNSISGAELLGGNTYVASAFTGTGFNGVGPTVGLYGLHPICCCSNWNVFYGGRFSVLFDGSSSLRPSLAPVRPAVVPVPLSANGASGSGNGNAFISEASLGMQYNHCLQCVPGIAFFRFAGEYQYWHVNSGADPFSRNSKSKPSSAAVRPTPSWATRSLGIQPWPCWASVSPAALCGKAGRTANPPRLSGSGPERQAILSAQHRSFRVAQGRPQTPDDTRKARG